MEVDPESGQARVLDHLVVQDVGRAINPAAVEGQIQGGVAQGVGWALLERMAYDGAGQLLSGSLMDYPLPQSDQAPPVRTVILELASEHGPFGAKGVGEPPWWRRPRRSPTPSRAPPAGASPRCRSPHRPSAESLPVPFDAGRGLRGRRAPARSSYGELPAPVNRS